MNHNLNSAFVNPITHHPLDVIHPGDVVWTWCKIHGYRTEHRYDPNAKKPLLCLDCEKERTTK